jgi:hypothetical protein
MTEARLLSSSDRITLAELAILRYLYMLENVTLIRLASPSSFSILIFIPACRPGFDILLFSRGFLILASFCPYYTMEHGWNRCGDLS